MRIVVPGGAVAVSGAYVVVAYRGRIVATGAIRGGTIAVGGGVHGAGNVPQARTATIASGAALHARAAGRAGLSKPRRYHLDVTGALVRTGGGTWLLELYDVTITSSNASGTTWQCPKFRVWVAVEHQAAKALTKRSTGASTSSGRVR